MECLPNKADKNVISFEISDIFQGNDINMSELNEDDIPDNLLRDLLDDPETLREISNETVKEPPQLDLCQQNTTTPSSKNRFKSVTKQDVDKIAGKSVTKKTHKQTTWGVKILRGEIFKQKLH